MRWRADRGPGQRQLALATRVKRWLVERAIGDKRLQRLALNRIFTNYGVEGTLCLVPYADHKVYVDPRDDRIAYSMLTGAGWQRSDLEKALNMAAQVGGFERDGVFVDVGANIGLMTIYALLSGYFERAVAIEPDPWNRQVLYQNLAINGLRDRVTVVAKAASDHSGKLALHRDRRNLGAHSLETGFVMSPGADAMVEVAPLDALVGEAGLAPGEISFIKIDVEGHEFAVLAGMERLITHRPPMLVEVTFDGNGAGAPEMAEVSRLLGQGYGTCHEIAGGEVIATAPVARFRSKGLQHELLFL